MNERQIRNKREVEQERVRGTLRVRERVTAARETVSE